MATHDSTQEPDYPALLSNAYLLFHAIEGCAKAALKVNETSQDMMTMGLHEAIKRLSVEGQRLATIL